MEIRAYTETDVSEVAALFTASVHELGVLFYDKSQLQAWAPKQLNLREWSNRLAKLQTIIAHEGNELAGFISYEPDGYIELLFTAPSFARRGVASLLYRHIEQALSGVSFFTEASLIAKPFFLHQGFHVVEEQNVTRNGVTLRRYAMCKIVSTQ